MNQNKKQNLVNKLAVGAASLAVTGAARAEFDPTTYTTQLGTAATVAGTIVGALCALGAGLMVWNKVKGFFGKAK